VISANEFPGHPLAEYRWEWLRNISDFDAHDDQYGVKFTFVPAIKYTLIVDYCDRQGTLLERLKNVEYKSTDPSDIFTEPLRVLVS
jgi:hypothetical protein